ncbi:MAG: hypothetical protein ACT4P9_07945 [Betaproteobacteria bacterium]
MLTIDVDVYKGPLINHDDMKLEQILGMALAAKPLLLNLRAVFENECIAKQPQNASWSTKQSPDPDCIPNWKQPPECPARVDGTTSAVPEGCLSSWQARRANVILALYSDMTPGSERLFALKHMTDLLIHSEQELREAIIAEGRKLNLPENPKRDPLGSIDDYRDLQIKMACSAFKRGLVTDPVAKQSLDAVCAGRSAPPEKDGWRRGRAEFARIYLSSEENRTILERLRERSRMLWANAFDALSDRSFMNRQESTKNTLDILARLAATLTDASEFAELMGPGISRIAPVTAKAAASDSVLRTRIDPVTDGQGNSRLDQFLQSLATVLRGDQGAVVAQELQALQGQLLAAGGAPTGLAIQHFPPKLEDLLRQLSSGLQGVIDTSFRGARGGRGIEEIMQRYASLSAVSDEEWRGLNQHRLTDKSLEDLEKATERRRKAREALRQSARTEVLNAMSNLGPVVAQLANLQALLPENRDEKGKRIQLLQAIGNSIINQTDDLLRMENRKEFLKKAAPAELEALRAAGASLSGAILADLVREIDKETGAVPGKTDISRALNEGDLKLRDAAGIMRREVATLRKTSADKIAEQAQWGLAGKALADAALLDKLAAAVKDKKDDAYAKAAQEALLAYVESRIAEEKPKADGGRTWEYAAAKVAVTEVFARKNPLKPGMSAAEAAKAWQGGLEEARTEAVKAHSVADAHLKVLLNWLGRTEAAMATQLKGPSSSKSDSALEVLDAVRGELEYQKVIAARAGLSALVTQIDNAIAFIHERRAGMQYIRPASLYLRDSYPATVLQRTPVDSDSVPNLLWRKFINAFKNETPEEDLAVRVQIDKQFWQTVNQIRLSGGGISNYVVVKDDIGNWYVRSYANDVTSVAKTMKGLALYSLGDKLQSNLLNKRLGGDASGASGAATPTERSILGKQLATANKDYRAELLKVVQAARDTVRELKDRLPEEAKEGLGGTKSWLSDARKAEIFKDPAGLPLDAADDEKKEVDKLGAELEKLLSGMVGYFKAAREKLKQLAEADTAASGKPADADLKSAGTRMWQFVRKAVDGRVTQSEKAGAKLEGRLLFIDAVADSSAAPEASAVASAAK